MSLYRKLHDERGIAWSEMCVLYCQNWMGQAMANAMAEASIPFVWLRDAQSKRNFDPAHESVKLITMHSSKGLEFPTVAACGVGALGVSEDRIEKDAKLLYVAMTRATDKLLITSSRKSSFTEKLEEMARRSRESVAA